MASIQFVAFDNPLFDSDPKIRAGGVHGTEGNRRWVRGAFFCEDPITETQADDGVALDMTDFPFDEITEVISAPITVDGVTASVGCGFSVAGTRGAPTVSVTVGTDSEAELFNFLGEDDELPEVIGVKVYGA